VNDEMDKCPQVKGVFRYQGCPVPDKDRDGIDDEADKCPDLPGVANSNGCPAIQDSLKTKIDQAAGKIVFANGKPDILKSSFVPLDNIAAILSANPNVLVDITSGKSGNKVLSENRAKAIADYLVGKGIVSSRIRASAGVKLQLMLHY
ncbi:MAG TPA: OmpA family protein, partial [Flavitalea sp.]|nr:OmpA family protein [Flavitalea sp.]